MLEMVSQVSHRARVVVNDLEHFLKYIVMPMVDNCLMMRLSI